MEIRLYDSVTSKTYVLTDTNEKVILCMADSSSRLDYESYELLDTITDKIYSLQVVNGKLILSDTKKKTTNTKIVLNDLVIEACGGKLKIRVATEEEKASDAMGRKLLDYLPIFVQNYAEIREIMETEQISVEKAWYDAANVMRDQFVADATSNGVKRWETILEIAPKATYTMDKRKINILARLNERLPYTIETLKSALTSICGTDGYILKLDHNNYFLAIKLSSTNVDNIEAVKGLLKRVVPANIVTCVSEFNIHFMLSDFTHEQLSKYIHKEVREENL